MREFEGEIEHIDLKYLSKSEIRITKIIINVMMNNKWNNFFLLIFWEIYLNII